MFVLMLYSSYNVLKNDELRAMPKTIDIRVTYDETSNKKNHQQKTIIQKTTKL